MVVQVNNCDCKLCVVFHSVSLNVVNYTRTCLVATSRGMYSLKMKLNHKRKYGFNPCYRSHPLTGLVETFSVGLVETCLNYPLATLGHYMQQFISELFAIVHNHVNAVFKL